MKFNFTKIELPHFQSPQPLELQKILNGIRDNPSRSISIDTGSFNFPHLHNIDEIMDAIESDRVNTIQLLEWLYCIYLKQEWDERHQDRSLSTAWKIWTIAKKKKQLKQFLFWDLALTYGGSSNRKLAKSLVEAFDSFNASQADKEIVDMLKILQRDSPDIYVAKISIKSLCTPHNLFKSYKLPTHTIDAVFLSYNRIPDLFVGINKPDDLQVKWLLECLEQMTVEQEVKAIDFLLTTIGARIGIDRPDLVNWISARYGATIDNYRWNQLSSQAKEALNKWKGAVNYGDFKKLIDTILDSSQIRLETWDQNRLKQRKIFWSHYTDRFERIRILVPRSSLESIEDIFKNRDIFILEKDSIETEICIFDFKEWFIVEFFRGDESEIRILPKTRKWEEVLFESTHLSVSSIRSLGGDIHDHVFCWQNSGVTWLREKNIYPNDGITFFEGIPRHASYYDPLIGLPPLKPEDRLERERKLVRWRQNWNRIEKPPIINIPTTIDEPDDSISDIRSIDYNDYSFEPIELDDIDLDIDEPDDSNSYFLSFDTYDPLDDIDPYDPLDDMDPYDPLDDIDPNDDFDWEKLKQEVELDMRMEEDFKQWKLEQEMDKLYSWMEDD